MEFEETDTSPNDLYEGRAVRALGIGICETSVVLTPIEEAKLNEDLEVLASQVKGCVRTIVMSELVY